MFIKNKYHISREFFPLMYYVAPVTPRLVKTAQRLARPPLFLFTDRSLSVEERTIPTYQDGEMEIIIITPKGLGENHPA